MRIPEAMLHLLAFFGGWPGAFLAQSQFRHKTAKVAFQATFWLIVLAHQLAFGFGLILPRMLPAVLGAYRPDIEFNVSGAPKEIFVTIDDAPSERTADILAVLEKYKVPATFFIISSRVRSGEQLEAIVKAGHSLGNHLSTTAPCSSLSLDEFRETFDACAGVLEKHSRPRLFRPPSDFGTVEQVAYARSKGYRTIIGTVFPLDHWISDPGWLVGLSRWLSTSGGILILHDGARRGPTTAAVLDRLIPKLKAAGYTFGRLDSTR